MRRTTFAAALAVVGLAMLTFTNTANALMQLSSDPAMRGRVMAIRLAIALGTTPAGAPLVGWIAHDVGPRWALGAAALAGGLAALVGLRHQRTVTPADQVALPACGCPSRRCSAWRHE